VALVIVGRLFLDVFFEHGPSQISEAKPPVLARMEVKVLCIDRLALRDLYVDLAKVGSKTMTDKDATQVEKQP
jgi:hypothetical protein